MQCLAATRQYLPRASMFTQNMLGLGQSFPQFILIKNMKAVPGVGREEEGRDVSVT